MEVMNIKIEPVDIEAHVKAAIINSAIGRSLEAALGEKLRGWEFDKAVRTVIDEEIPKIIRSVMLEDGLRERLAKAVRDALTESLCIEIANRSIDQIWNRR
jgi:hypothetical protein